MALDTSIMIEGPVAWREWLHRRYSTDYGTYTVIEWVESLVYEGISDMFQKAGYIYSRSKHETVNTLLNYIYRFDIHSPRRLPTQYLGEYGRNLSYTSNDLEFYLEHKCPPCAWDTLKKEYTIQHFADDSDFAERLWIELPSFLFFQIDIDKSGATEELYSRIAWLESDDSEEGDFNVVKRRGVDPYLLDYGKNRYKAHE
jgi:hypothetical protein